MTKTYAAFYLPQDEPQVKIPEQKNVDRITGTVRRALNNAKLSLNNFDISEIARNIDLQSPTEFTQRYAVGALTDIINGRAVTNKTMLDSLFNTYAPALNAGLAQTGFNSLVEMRNAVEAGNINVANFVQGFSNGLSVVQQMSIEKPAKYGEEIPIDVVTQLDYTYNLKTPTQKIPDNDLISKYTSELDNIKLKLSAIVQNENAELWNINDFNTKIIDIMVAKTPITFRAGKSIYDDCIISTYAPVIDSIHKIKLTCELVLNYNTLAESYTQNNARIMKLKPPVGDFDRNFYNLASSETYNGIVS